MNISNCTFKMDTTEEIKQRYEAINNIASAFEANAAGLSKLVDVLANTKGPDAMIKINEGQPYFASGTKSYMEDIIHNEA